MVEIIRNTFTTHSTIGQLTINGQFVCYTLEDVCRPEDVKIKGETAIPQGWYNIIINQSSRFNRLMPLLYNWMDLSVQSGSKSWTGIRIHPGNSNADTDGCILVGMEKKTDWVGRSNDAFNILFPKLEAMLLTGPLRITIINAQL